MGLLHGSLSWVFVMGLLHGSMSWAYVMGLFHGRRLVGLEDHCDQPVTDVA